MASVEVVHATMSSLIQQQIFNTLYQNALHSIRQSFGSDKPLPKLVSKKPVHNKAVQHKAAKVHRSAALKPQQIKRLFPSDVAITTHDFSAYLKQRSIRSFALAELKIKQMLADKTAKWAPKTVPCFTITLQNKFEGLMECTEPSIVQLPRRSHRVTHKRQQKRIAKVQGRLSRIELNKIRSLRPQGPVRHTQKSPEELRELLYAKINQKREQQQRSQARDKKYAHLQAFASNDKAEFSVNAAFNSALQQIDLNECMKLVQDSEIYADQILALPRFLFENQENELFWHARWLHPFLEKHGLYEYEMIQAYKKRALW